MTEHTEVLPFISGIQQIGIGVKDAHEAWDWYRKYFKMDVPIFEDAATASLMTKYTSGKAEDRHAILALNLQGGGGFEIWQYTSITPRAADFQITLGDLGVFAVKIRTRDILETFRFFTSEGLDVIGTPALCPDGRQHFYLRDPYGNMFEMVENSSWFNQNGDLTGGVAGCVIGVSNIEKALPLYQNILRYKFVSYDKTDFFEDFNQVSGGNDQFRRVLLQGENERKGAFSKLLCQTEIELVEVKTRQPHKIFKDRNWGDLGFIHLCFDIWGMKALSEKCTKMGFPFTVDSSNSFDMGKAAGHFSYVEDPDGTLIEFVETHKIPILEKWGWYLNMKNRKPEKPLPKWMLRMLSLNRKKN